MSLKNRNLIKEDDLTLSEIDEILDLSDNIIAKESDFSDVCKGKLLATLFFEPSTRTRFSFEAAMLRLGGQIIGFSDPKGSSTSKGESLPDTFRTIEAYSDMIVMRHPKEGAPLLGSRYVGIPVVNAGDGGHHHPTQTLTDLLTIRTLLGKISNLKVGLCGDLKFGRTAHSLVGSLNRYENISFKFISPKELKIPDYITEKITKNDYTETSYLEKAIDDLDILYMTRIQKERFLNEEEYLRLKGIYILDKKKMNLAKESMIVMHPLPRVDEISTEIDSDERAVYFKQAKYGMYARMALIMKLLGVEKC